MKFSYIKGSGSGGRGFKGLKDGRNDSVLVSWQAGLRRVVLGRRGWGRDYH